MIEETRKHIAVVQELLSQVIENFAVRAEVHDASKLESPEAEVFEEFTPQLNGLTFGSKEYYEALKAMKPALDHHYANNSHHPEHFPNVSTERSRRLALTIVALEEMPENENLSYAITELKVDLAEAESRINGMSLFDIHEMLVDWWASTRRHANGDIMKSIEHNQPRFAYSDEFKQILINTIQEMQR